MRTRGRGGQGLVETILCLPLLLLFISAIGILAYRSVLFHIAEYHLHEALICEADSAASHCQKELEARLKKVLIGKENFHVTLNKSRSQVQGKVVISLKPQNLQVEQTFKRRL